MMKGRLEEMAGLEELSRTEFLLCVKSDARSLDCLGPKSNENSQVEGLSSVQNRLCHHSTFVAFSVLCNHVTYSVIIPSNQQSCFPRETED